MKITMQFILLLALAVCTLMPVQARDVLDDLGTALDVLNGLLEDEGGKGGQPPTGANALFADDFKRSALGPDWKVVDDPAPSENSSWSVNNGTLAQRSNIFRTEQEYEFYQGTHIVTGNPDWRNYQLYAQITSTDDDGFGVIIRYQDKDNYYRFITVQDGGNGGPFRRLEKFVNGKRTVLAEKKAGFEIGKTYEVRVSASGNRFSVQLDKEMALAAVDDTFRAGRTGFLTYANPGLMVAKVRVIALKEAPAANVITLNGPSASALLAKEYPTSNFRLTLGVNYSKPGIIIDTVGINAAPAGSFALSVDAAGRITFQVYAPAVQSAARIPNGWHVFSSASVLPSKADGEITVEVGKQEVVLYLNGKAEKRVPMAVTLSGQPIYAGDFPGDDHWGSKYNIHPAMTGTLKVNYCGPLGDSPTGGNESATGEKPILTPVPTDNPGTVEAGVKKIEAAFRAGNVAELVKLTVPARRATYQPIFQAHQTELPRIADLLATRKLVANNGAFAEYQVAGNGRTAPVYFERVDGVWCLAEL